jgi:hypothetical protein
LSKFSFYSASPKRRSTAAAPVIAVPKKPKLPVTGMLGLTGVGVATAISQVQFVLLVQDGFRHDPSTQVKPLAQSLVTVQVLLQDAIDLVVGVGVGELQTQSVSPVHSGLRHIDPEQTSPDAQSEFRLQA